MDKKPRQRRYHHRHRDIKTQSPEFIARQFKPLGEVAMERMLHIRVPAGLVRDINELLSEGQSQAAWVRNALEQAVNRYKFGDEEDE